MPNAPRASVPAPAHLASSLPPMRAVCAALGLMLGGAALAQQPAPSGTSAATEAARRFPQPVRVSDLIGRTVLRPLESRPVLGHVAQVVRSNEGAVEIVVEYGGLFGIGGRPIAVPADAMALLGADLEIVDLTPAQLSRLPRFDAAGSAPIALDGTIRMGLARPSH